MKPIMDPAAVKAALTQALAAAKAGGATTARASMTARRRGYLRFAANTGTTSGEDEHRSLEISVSRGEQQAAVSTEDTSKTGVQRATELALAKMAEAPPNPEYMPPVGPQKFAPHPWAADDTTASVDPNVRARAVKTIIDAAKEAKLVAAGLFEEDYEEDTTLASTGLSGFYRSTTSSLITTVRKPDGSSSGYAGALSVRASDLNAEALAKRAVADAQNWTNPVELPPGKYTVVLTPLALDPVLSYVFGGFDARSNEEGRGPLAKPGGSTRVGEQLFSPKVTLVSDPADQLIPGMPWGEGGLPAEKQTLIEKGVVKALRRNRFWAQKTKQKPTIDGGNYRLMGGGKKLEELIAGCEKGLLISHIWYVRYLNPQALSVTGLTRDATFLIENGKVTKPAKNFRFNVSLLDVLKNVDDLGQEEMVQEFGALPAARIKDFTMSSISEAI
jgi:predicted Zn-dependent protease